MNPGNVRKLSWDGRLSIPPALQALVGMKPGDTVEITVKGKALVLQKVERTTNRTGAKEGE